MKVRRKETICPNCQTELRSTDNFCPNCGQENHSKQARIGVLINDFVGDYFTFDSKFFRSAKKLIFKPGSLTNEYRKGRRASYISPIRLYLFTSFIYFLIMQFSIDFNNSSNGVMVNGEKLDQAHLIEAEKTYGSIDKFVEAEFSDVPSIGQLLLKKSMLIIRDGKNLVQYWLSNMSLMALVLLPVVAWMLMLVFRRNQDFYTVHLVHVIHLQSFTYLALILFLVIANLDQALASILLIVIMLVYQFFSFLRTYKRSVGTTIYKSLIASFWYLVILVVGMLSTLALSLLLF